MRNLRHSSIVHLHKTHGACSTECGLDCQTVAVAYRGRNPEEVTCSKCLQLAGKAA